VLGSTMIILVCPLALRFLPTSSTAGTSAGQAAVSRLQLARSRQFLTISLAFALGLFAQIGLFAHLVSRLAPALGQSFAAGAISLTTLCAILGRTLFGWLIGDRDRRSAAAVSLSIQAMGSLLLAYGSGFPSLVLGCVLFGLGVGNLTSLPPLIAQREFSTVDAPTVVALVTSINQAVFAFAPAIFGALRETTDNYTFAFLFAGVLQIVAATVILGGRRFS
jgi:predicted MFS family arabinose efflux permease